MIRSAGFAESNGAKATASTASILSSHRSAVMLPRIVHPEQLQGFRLHAQDHCRLALLSAPADGDDDRGSGEAMTLFLEIHEPCDRVPPHSHHRSAEFYFVLRGTVLFHIDDRSITAHTGDFVVVPADAAHDFENPGPDRLYLLTVLNRDEGFSELVKGGIPTALDPEDLEVLRNL